MYNSKNSTSSTGCCDSDYYNSSSNSSSAEPEKELLSAPTIKNGTQTIFDTPDFVIDAYLDAINGGSSKNTGILILSNKYCSESDTKQGDFNCNHNPKECPCTATKDLTLGCCTEPGESVYEPQHFPPEDVPKCPCNSENPYEEGNSPFVEPLKSHCGCHSGSPYEKGETPHDEERKPCCSPCGPPYEDGANPFKDTYKTPAHDAKPEPEKPKPVERDVAKLYPLECKGATHVHSHIADTPLSGLFEDIDDSTTDLSVSKVAK